MKQKLFWGQLAAIGLVLIGVAGIGVLLFTRHGLDDLGPLYGFAGLGVTGFLANAALAVIRVLWEKDGRK